MFGLSDLPIGWAIFAGALAGFGALALLFDGSGGRRRALDRRLAVVAAPARRTAAAARSIRNRPREAGPAWPPIVEKILPVGREFGERLLLSGLTISPGRFRLLFAVAAIVGAALTVGVTGSRGLGAAVGLGLGLAGPRLLMTVLIARRRARFLLQFPDAIDLMIRSLRAGLPVDEAVVTVGSEGGDAVAPEFRRVAERLAVGQPLEDSLWHSARRLELPDFDFFIVCLTVQRETGGKLTETLANLSDILRRRLQMRLKVKAMSAEARTSAGIIGSLPFILAAALYAANPGYIASLFHDPRGQIIVVAALASEALGIFTMIRMARFRI
ncbi:type II secretion system F family protein [Thalassobaculum fulvum]|uniref:type II secretion system F family protein n=1 Tax=Thalassobaculum fulvum TaxID=1633335 RepID=UPI00167A8415|nr:type II secretion system F family protein [Thalassobaculum fulvum]